MARQRVFDLRRLDQRGLLGEAPSPPLLAAVTFVSVLVLGLSMFFLGRVDLVAPGLLFAAVAVAGLAIAVGGALAVMQFRWAEQLDRANRELVLVHEQLGHLREHHRTVVHDAKATVAAIGAAVHALQVAMPDGEIPEAMSQQLSQLRATLDSRAVDVEPFPLQDAFTGLAAFTALHDVDLSVRPTDAVVLGDANTTLQILQNLVDNSRKYAPQSTVRVWSESAGDQHHLVIVEDDGSGIDPHDVDMLFKPGVRSGSSNQGFGMGLAISLQLAEAQGASLWYDDSWRGARFVLKLRNGDAS